MYATMQLIKPVHAYTSWDGQLYYIVFMIGYSIYYVDITSTQTNQNSNT